MSTTNPRSWFKDWFNKTLEQFFTSDEVRAFIPVADPTSPESVTSFWVGSQAQYDALTPDSTTLYFIV